MESSLAAFENLNFSLPKFIKALSEVDAWYYGVLLPETDPNSLSKLLGINQGTLLGLLCRAKLGFQRKETVCLANDKIKALLSHIANVEVTKHYYQSKMHLFICIGKIRDSSPQSPGLMHLCCQPNFYRLRSFARARDFLKLSASISPSLVAGITDRAAASTSPDKRKRDPGNASEQDTKKKYIGIKDMLETNLLSALFVGDAKEREQLWRSDINESATIDMIISLADHFRQVRELDRSQKLNYENLPPDIVKDKATPTLMEYGIRLGDNIDRRVVNGLLHDIIQLNSLPGIDDLFNIDCWNGRVVQLIQVPQSNDLNRLKQNEWIHKWLDQFFHSIISNQDSNRSENAEVILTFFGQKFKTEFGRVACNIGLPIITKMSVEATFAMMSDANVSFKQQRVISRHVRLHCGGSLFAPERRIKQCLGGEFIVPICGCYKFGREKIEWSYKPTTKISNST